MFRSLALAGLVVIVAVAGSQAQERCDKVNVSFLCKDGTVSNLAPFECRAGESRPKCCGRWRRIATMKWCFRKGGGLKSFGCRCPESNGRFGDAARSKPALRGVLGPDATIDGNPHKPIIAGRLPNPRGTRGGAAAEPSDPARRRAPRTLGDRTRVLSRPKIAPETPRRGDESFPPGGAYSGVRLQQGRVLTDSDLNAQMSRVCRKIRYDLVCRDGTPEGVNIVCKPGEPAAKCCQRGRHAAIKDCLRHGGVARMKCACPRGSYKPAR